MGVRVGKGNTRWFTCECRHEWCRERFQMTVTEHRDAVLSNNRVVLYGHTSPGDRVLAMHDGILLIEGGA